MEVANQEYKEALAQAGQIPSSIPRPKLMIVGALLKELQSVLGVALGAEQQGLV